MKKNPQEDLAHIRSMMERSSRFISLSGISGVVAGIIAILASVAVVRVFKNNGIIYADANQFVYSEKIWIQLILIAIVTLILAIGSGIFFAHRKSKKHQVRLWTGLTAKLLISMAIPLIAGGIFCIALLYHGLFLLIAPATLIFYGLALVNASKYTFNDVEYLGYSEILLGLMAMFITGYGLIFWALGFGVMHIIYGSVMYRKYE